MSELPSSILNPLSSLPHAPPFVFVREVISCEAGCSVEARTSFGAEDPIFAGHFPGNPLVPGVILTEALAQAAGIAAASGYPETARPMFLLSAIRTMKFFKAVRPEETIDLRAEKLGEVENMVQFKVAASVNSVLVAEGQLVLSVTGSFAPGPE